MISEQVNIEKINLGDKATFEMLFKKHYKEMCAYACRFELEIETAEEIVQELFVNIWNKRESLHISSSFRSYLFQSVRNYSLNYIKHAKIKHAYKEHNQRKIQEQESQVEDHLESEELKLKIQHAIDELPPERKKVFLMSRFEELKYSEIAEKLGISVKTVETQMSKALKHLKTKLSEYLPLLSMFVLKIIDKFFN